MSLEQKLKLGKTSAGGADFIVRDAAKTTKDGRQIELSDENTAASFLEALQLN